jgi:hypothetical protein
MQELNLAEVNVVSGGTREHGIIADPVPGVRGN